MTSVGDFEHGEDWVGFGPGRVVGCSSAEPSAGKESGLKGTTC